MTDILVAGSCGRPAQVHDASRIAARLARYRHRLAPDDETALLASAWSLLDVLRVPAARQDGPDGTPRLVARGSIVVEACTSGSAQEVAGRLRRHVACPPVTAFILVTPVAAHRTIPWEACGVPVHVIWLGT